MTMITLIVVGGQLTLLALLGLVPIVFRFHPAMLTQLRALTVPTLGPHYLRPSSLLRNRCKLWLPSLNDTFFSSRSA